jgi:hypothetical protein
MSETIIVAAMHRSGSTHISKTISTAKPGIYHPASFLSLGTLGDDPHGLVYEIAQHHKVRLDSLPFVMHSHTLASVGTMKIIEASRIDKVVVVTRNVMNALRSVCTAHNNGASMPNVHLPSDWKEWEASNQMMWLIHNFAPWMFAFYVTWLQRAPQALMVNYESHYANETAGNKRLFDYLDIKSGTNVFKFSDEEDRRISGEKPEVTGYMRVELEHIARSWGPGLYQAMQEDGIV